jgi:hypothetical protein
VGIVPFAPAVNVGSEYFSKITGKADDPDPDGDGYNYPDSCYKKSGKLKGSCEGDSEYKAKKYAKCVVERTGSNEANDAAPAGNSTYLPTWNDAADSNSTTCTPSAKIIPLTTNKEGLKQAIKDLKASGSTAGQLGTALAFYMLSPKWSTVWPDDSKPANYGAEKVRKVAVLMTDGEYNTLQGRQYNDGSSQATSALNKAKALCSAMKKNAAVGDPNIKVWTVGFQLDSNAAKAMLSDCATDPKENVCNAENGDQLKACFRRIALDIVKLRLTN